MSTTLWLRLRRTVPISSWSLSLLLLGLSLPAEAHNGTVALAYPMERITVDESLSDWPEDIRRYPLSHPVPGEKPRDGEDYQGAFCIGYSEQENVLYIGVEVLDASVGVDAQEDIGRYILGGCHVKVDLEHRVPESLYAEYTMQKGHRSMSGSARGLAMKVEEGRQDDRHVFEWRIASGDTFRFHSEKTLGVNVSVEVRAEEDFPWSTWGGRTSLGDVVLMREATGTGRLQGKVSWAGLDNAVARGKVWIQSSTAEEVGVQALTDQQGTFGVELPAGKYTLKVESPGRGAKEEVVAEVQEGRAEVVALKVAMSPGLVAGVGKGKRVKAGGGIRHGLWQSLGVPDGLPSGGIRAILQDQRGYLWFATDGGVSRYDGEGFVTFTTEDGLAGRYVWSMLEDREGRLWFGSQDGGVSRYDGQSWTTFTQADGLASNAPTSILQDRAGHVWFGTYDGGVSRYDGRSFQTLTRQDGPGQR